MPVENAGRAVLDLRTDDAQFNAALLKAEAKARELGVAFQNTERQLRSTAGGIGAVAMQAEYSTRKIAGMQTQLGGVTRSMQGLASAFGVAISGAALVGFGKSVLALGDNLQKVADRTGMTTEQVQRLSYVAGQSGNNIEEITAAFGVMQDRLASGDKSAVAALKTIGVSFQEISEASPYQQIQMVARALAQIPDPAMKVAMVKDLLGKGSAAIIPTLIANFDELAAKAPVMADKTVRALDDIGDRLDAMWANAKVKGGNFLVGTIDYWNSLPGPIQTVAEAMGGLALALWGVSSALTAIRGSAAFSWLMSIGPAGLVALAGGGAALYTAWNIQRQTTPSSAGQPVPGQGLYSAADIKEAQESGRIKPLSPTGTYYLPGKKPLPGQDDAAKKAAAEAQRRELEATKAWIANYMANEQAVFDTWAKVQDHMDTVSKQRAEDWRAAQWKAATALKTELSPSLVLSANAANDLHDAMQKVNDSLVTTATLGDRLKMSLHDAFAGIPQLIVNSFTGGGGIMGAIRGVASTLGNAVTQSIGKVVGGTLGGIIGPLGSLAGMAVGWIGGLFGPGKEYKQSVSTRAEMEARYGGVESLIKQVSQAYATLERPGTAAEAALKAFWNARTPQALESAFKVLTTAIDDAAKKTNDLAAAAAKAAEEEAKHSPEAMQAIAERYGFSGDVLTKGMGATYWSGIIGSQSKTIMQDFDQLLKGGANREYMIAGMGGAVSSIVSQALAAGVAIPGYLQAMVDSLASWGQLVDENGQALDISTLKYDQAATWQDESLLATKDLTTATTDLAGTMETLPDRMADAFAARAGALEADRYHAGGLVMARAWMHMPRLHTGGEMPAWLLPGEGVLSRDVGMPAVGGAAGLDALNRGDLPRVDWGDGPTMQVVGRVNEGVLLNITIDKLFRRLAQRGGQLPRRV